MGKNERRRHALEKFHPTPIEQDAFSLLCGVAYRVWENLINNSVFTKAALEETTQFNERSMLWAASILYKVAW